MTIDLRWPSSKKETLDPIDYIPPDSAAARLWIAEEQRKRREEEAFAAAEERMQKISARLRSKKKPRGKPMSDRQQRMARKARRRRAALLARAFEYPGATFKSATFDLDHQYGLAISLGDRRQAARAFADRRWRHMDPVADRMFALLCHWADSLR